jgi:phospholipid/cholesterol/gamma-HCH transport system substrate-binding protein
MRADLMRVGAILLIGISLLMVGLRFLQARFSEHGHYRIYVQFRDARNVSLGASVLMAGVPVGFVREIALTGTPPVAELTLAIREEVKIPRGSTFRLVGGALLPTETRVEIIPPALVADYIKPNERVQGENPLDFNAAVSRLTPEAEQTLMELRRTLGAARALLEDKLLRRSLLQTLDAVEKATDQTTRLLSQAERLVSENRATVRQLLTQATEATRELKLALQNANRLLQDPQTREDLQATLASARAAAERAEAALQEVNTLVSDPQLQEDIRQTAHNVRSLSERANTLADKTETVLDNAAELTRNLNETVTESKAVIQQAKTTFERVENTLQNAVSLRTLGFEMASYRLEMGFNTGTERYRTDVLVTLFTPDQRTVSLGLYDFTESNGLIAQYGTPLSPQLHLRYGLYGGKPGVGVDYRISQRGLLTLDLFDPNDWRGSLRLNWRVSESIFLWGGIESPFRYNQPAFGIRIER